MTVGLPSPGGADAAVTSSGHVNDTSANGKQDPSLRLQLRYGESE